MHSTTLPYLLFLAASVAFAEHPYDRPCADYNNFAAAGSMAGLYDVYVCPRDGISNRACVEKVPVKNSTDVEQSTIDGKDYLLYMLIGKATLHRVALHCIELR
jgi:hypothetical protein